MIILGGGLIKHHICNANLMVGVLFIFTTVEQLLLILSCRKQWKLKWYKTFQGKVSPNSLKTDFFVENSNVTKHSRKSFRKRLKSPQVYFSLSNFDLLKPAHEPCLRTMLTQSLVQTVVARRFGDNQKIFREIHKCYFFPDRYFPQKVNALSNMPEKTADISRAHHWFPSIMTSAQEKWAHNDDASLPRSW